MQQSPRTLHLVAHNIRSLWNVGSLFRTSDAFGVARIHLTGYTGTPPRIEITKTAIGAEEAVAWSYERDPLSLIRRLRDKGMEILALEKTDMSIPLHTYDPPVSACLILGNEIEGVAQVLLSEADQVLHIPMLGMKESLNVSVAAGIAIHHLKTASMRSNA